MSDLATLQRQVANAIRLRQALPHGYIRDTASVSSDIRIAVYQEAYILRLDEALRTNFPKLHQILGDDDMLQLTMGYQDAYPSMRPSIRWFGDTLPEYLSRAKRYAAMPILAELARFEWALAHTFDAGDATSLSVDVLAQLGDEDWPNIKLTFHPAFALLAMEWNTISVWRAINNGEAPPAPTEHIQSWAIWRQDFQPTFRSLPEDEAALLHAVHQGQLFLQACESLLPWHSEDDAPMRAAGLLGQWLNEGWITQLQT